MDKMRTARLVEIGRMECEEIEIPPPQKGQVMIRSEMASICGSDLHRVMMGALMEHQLPCPHGYPGHEGIGMVVESHAEGISEGTHVLVFPNPTIGECFSEFQRVDGCYCLPLPSSDLPRSHLLMAQQLGTVIFAMKQYPRDVFGKTVAVIGQGSAGLFWTYLLKQAGAEKVIVSDLSDARLSMAKRYGADVCVNAQKDELKPAVMDLTNGVGVDYVVEAVGSSETLLQSIDLVQMDGELHWFGLPEADQDIPFSFYKFFHKRLKSVSVYGAQDEPSSSSFKKALKHIHEKKIDVEPLLSHCFNIEDINKAMNLAHNPTEGETLKVSITFD